MKRNKVIMITCFENEYEKISTQSQKEGKSIARFLRDRGKEPDLSHAAMLGIILAYINNKSAVKTDKDLDWDKKKQELKKSLSVETVGMSKTTKKKYEEKVKQTVDTAKEMIEELGDILMIQKQKIEATEDL